MSQDTHELVAVVEIPKGGGEGRQLPTVLTSALMTRTLTATD